MLPAARQSLVRRIWAGTALVALCLAGLLSLLAATLIELEETQERIFHAEDLIDVTHLALSDLKDAETAQRGYLLTRDEDFLEPLLLARRQLPTRLARLQHLVESNLPQARRLADFQEMAEIRMAQVDEVVAIAQREELEGIRMRRLLDRGRQQMDVLRTVGQTIITSEQALLQQRAQTARQLGERARIAAFTAVPLVVLLLGLATYSTTRRIRDPLQALRLGAARVGAREPFEAVPVARDDEFGALTRDFNAMAERLEKTEILHNESLEELRSANAAIARESALVAAQSGFTAMLARTAQRLQRCEDEAEFAMTVAKYGEQLLPGLSGLLYLLNNSGNLLVEVSAWGGPSASEAHFKPADCWSIRRMGIHVVPAPDAEVLCRHVAPAMAGPYRCVPLLAEGQALGVLHVWGEMAAEGSDQARGEEIRLVGFAESAALALHNLRLRRALRDSAIRDPLTGVYNRRYMEELIAIEDERAVRSQTPISVLMIDADHFKRFNDRHGHHTGDLVLKELARVVQRALRKGDVACRYGGEEFLCIMPGMDSAAAMERADQILAAVRGISLAERGTSVGRVTCSIGVAAYPAQAASLRQALDQADEALYVAKREGRDRAVLAGAGPAAADFQGSPHAGAD